MISVRCLVMRHMLAYPGDRSTPSSEGIPVPLQRRPVRLPSSALGLVADWTVLADGATVSPPSLIATKSVTS